MSGPAVYLDYDQAALDRAYDQRQWADNAADLIAWYGEASARAHARLACTRDIAYGDTPAERLDFFPAHSADAPVVVYVHGGAWRQLGKADSAFAAEAFVAQGIAYVALGFGIVPQVRLPEMVAQVRRAIAWLWHDGPAYGIARDRLHLCGHSSGAHLAANALATDWTAYGDVPPDVVKGALCASGPFDLAPVALSARGRYLELAEAEIAAYSAPRHAAHVPCPVTVAHGTRESPEFVRQSRAYHAALTAAGVPAELTVGRAMNHFEISATLAWPEGVLNRAMRALIHGPDKGGPDEGDGPAHATNPPHPNSEERGGRP